LLTAAWIWYCSRHRGIATAEHLLGRSLWCEALLALDVGASYCDAYNKENAHEDKKEQNRTSCSSRRQVRLREMLLQAALACLNFGLVACCPAQERSQRLGVGGLRHNDRGR
jgi:hypothetical protein